MGRPQVLLADDHTLVLEAFEKLLQATCDVVGTVSDGLALLEAAPRLHPDVAVIDIAMPRLNGLEAGRRLKQMMPLLKLIYVTMNEDPDVALRAMQEGGSGYLLKQAAATELFQAIRIALKGSTYVGSRVALKMQQAFMRDPHGKSPDKELTARQREVLRLLSEGKSMRQAAEILSVTPRTIAFHKYRMMEDLGVATTAELIRMGLKNKYVAA